MPAIRLMREVTDPGSRGPSRGMCALQLALREASIPWLRIGGCLRNGEVPWVWSYQDAQIALQFNDWGWPFIIGPNVLFQNSKKPRAGKYEPKLLDAECCALQFTESEWYAALIERHCNHNEAPIVLWSYPIDPQPDGPLPVEHDLLIYLKDMTLGREVIRAQRRWPNSNVVVYGHYDRDVMIDLARKSRFCLYCSTDDRGPLALAEIMLAGCPAIGVPQGSPWIETGMSGVSIPHWGHLIESEPVAAAMDRDAVREWALERFATSRTVEIIRKAFEPIVMGESK